MDFLANAQPNDRNPDAAKQPSSIHANAKRELAEWQKRWSGKSLKPSFPKQQFEDARSKSVEKFRDSVLAHAKTEATRILNQTEAETGLSESETAQGAKWAAQGTSAHQRLKVARDYLARPNWKTKIKAPIWFRNIWRRYAMATQDKVSYRYAKAFFDVSEKGDAAAPTVLGEFRAFNRTVAKNSN